MSLEHWWNNPDQGKLRYSEKKIWHQYHFVHKNPTWNGLGLQPGFYTERLVTICLIHGTHLERYNCDRHLYHTLQGKITWRGIFGAINCNS